VLRTSLIIVVGIKSRTQVSGFGLWDPFTISVPYLTALVWLLLYLNIHFLPSFLRISFKVPRVGSRVPS